MIDLNSFPIFTENKATLKEISKDDSDYKNIRYMTELLKEAVSFDLVKRHYVNGLGPVTSSILAMPFSQADR